MTHEPNEATSAGIREPRVLRRLPRLLRRFTRALALVVLGLTASAEVAQAQTMYAQIGPGGQTVSNPWVNYWVVSCSTYDYARLRTTGAEFRVNGGRVTPNSPVSLSGNSNYSSCWEAFQWNGLLALQRGTNVFKATVPIYGVGTAPSDSVVYTLLQIEPRVASGIGGEYNATPNIQFQASYGVQNVGNGSGQILISWYCEGAVSCASGSRSPVIAVGADTTIAFNVQAGTTGGNGKIHVIATGQDGSLLSHQLYTNVTVDSPISAVAVSPDGENRTLPGAATNKVYFTVSVPANVNYQQTLNLTATCSTTCSPSQSTLVAGPNTSSLMHVDVQTSGTVGSTGWARLKATVSGASVADSGNVNYTVTAPVNLRVLVYAISDTVRLTPERDTIVSIAVVNDGDASDTYNLTATPNLSVADSAIIQSTVTYSAHQGGNLPLRVKGSRNLSTGGSVLVSAVSQSSSSVTASFSFPFKTRDRYAVMPRRATLLIAQNADSAVRFSVENQRSVETQYQFEIRCATGLTCTPVQNHEPVPPEGTSPEYRIGFHTPSVSRLDTMRIIARGLQSLSVDTGFVVIQTGNGVPPNVPPRAPYIALAAEQASWKHRNTSLCLADCFEEVQRISTPAYISQGQARALTFEYRYNLGAVRQSFFEFDVVDSSTVAADSISIRLQKPDASPLLVQTTSQASSAAYFRTYGAHAYRIGVFAWTSGVATGVYDATATITAHFASGDSSRTIPLKYVVRNEQDSPFGLGITLSGLQEMKSISGGGKLILDGNGGWSYFSKVNSNCSSNCRYTTPNGDFSTLRDTVIGGLVEYRRTYPDSTVVRFNSTNLMVTAHRYGDTTKFNRGSNGRLDRIEDPTGRGFQFNYTDGWVFNAELNDYVYETGTKLNSVTDPGSRSLGFSRSGGGNTITGIAEPGGYQHILNQDRRGGSWIGVTTTFKLSAAYSPQVDIAGVGTASPATTIKTREEQLIGVAGYSKSTAGRVLSADTLWTKVTDPRGYVTKYRLDRFGAPTIILTPDGATSTIYRDSLGRIYRVVDASGNERTFDWYRSYLVGTWDKGANLKTMTTHDTISGKVTENVNNRVVRTAWLSSHGLVDSVRTGPDTSTGVVRYTYDSKDRLIQSTDPGGHGTVIVYQTTGAQNVDSTRTIGRTKGTKMTYDVFGRTVATRDPQLTTDTTAYDAFNRVTYTAKADRTIRNTYDALYLTKVVISGKDSTIFVPNAQGWITGMTDVNGKESTFAYDAAGNAVGATNRRNQTFSASYNAMSEPVTTTGDLSTHTFYSDPAGQYSFVANAVSSDTVRYDAAGRPTQVITVRGSRVYRQTIGYDAEGRRRTHTLQAPNQSSTSRWNYDANGRLSSLMEPQARDSTSIRYNLEGAVTGVFTPGVNLDLATSGAHAPHNMVYYDANTNISALRREYGYDGKTGLITDRIQPDSQTGVRYSYDVLGQLKSAIPYTLTDPSYVCGTSVDPYTGEQLQACKNLQSTLYTGLGRYFSYDSLGNRKDSTVILPGNRLTSYQSRAYSYDHEGNLSLNQQPDGTWRSFTWSPDGKLSKVVRLAGNQVTRLDSATFLYDAMGRRVQKKSAQGTVDYLWDGDNLLAQLDSTGAVVVQYTYLDGIDKPHSARYNGRSYYFTTEAPGSVSGLVSDSSVVAARWDYDEWGAPRTRVGNDSLPITLRFAAREYDGETGLYYNRARYYDPQIGRFISEDPIGLAGGFNAYAYAGNNPTNATDPSGLEVQCEKSWTSGITIAGRDGQILVEERGYWTTVCWGDGGSSWTNKFVFTREMQDFAMGATMGPLGGGTTAKAVLGSKVDFMLGFAKGVKNLARAREMASSLRSMGLGNTAATRAYLAQHLSDLLTDASNIAKNQLDGRVVRESLLMGPRGAAKLRTVWEDARLITINIFRGR